jgi:GR25 family glycosyltransferase involved in LPS biosynthesis
MQINCLVINVASNAERRNVISDKLGLAGIEFRIVPAVTTDTVNLPNLGNMNLTAVAVWQSHLNCLKDSAKNDAYTLILEDDATIGFESTYLTEAVSLMSEYKIDFLQIGYLKINVFQFFSILMRNLYNFFVSKGLFVQFFSRFGLNEVKRAKNQKWLKRIPSNYVLNDIRYGAHCYVVSPSFSAAAAKLNNPPFLSADDFYVSLGKMKSFRMFRLSKSLSKQGHFISSFIKRYGIEGSD